MRRGALWQPIESLGNGATQHKQVNNCLEMARRIIKQDKIALDKADIQACKEQTSDCGAEDAVQEAAHGDES